jgi:hypothetical protein
MSTKDQLDDGLYFGLPEDDYHAQQRLSNSGIKWLQVSTLDFWHRSWMNPDYEYPTTKFMDEGNAWHKRILEGPDAFYNEYAAALDPADYPGVLITMDDLKGRLRGLGEKVGGSKADLIDRLIRADPEAPIWDVAVDLHALEHKGKKLVPADLIDTIEKQAAMIEKHPDISRCFSGGMPEVTVLWTDSESGVPMKARLDYVKPRADIDLKTFSNPLGKPIDRAIATAMAGGKYHVQCAVYSEAMDHAIDFIQTGGVHGDVDKEWLKSLDRQREFVFVFQQTGVPVARAKVFPKYLTYDIGRIAMRDGIAKFAECSRVFGSDMWIDVEPIGVIEDSDLPAWIGE